MSNKKIYLSDTMKAFASELHTFDKLKSLKYWSKFQQISDVELLLKGCIHLTKLTLGASMDGNAVEKQDLETWMRAEVKQVNSLTHLTVDSQCRCDVMEYLVYKYPNIQKINIQPNYYDSTFAEDMTKFKSNMNRVLQAIRSIPVKSMLIWLPKNENIFEIAEFFTQKGYSFNVKKTQGDLCYQVEIQGI